MHSRVRVPKKQSKLMSLKLRKQDGDASGSGEAAESEAMTSALVDMVANDLMREDKEMNDIKNHFKKWKF